MRKYLFFIAFCILHSCVFTQVNIGGVINTYTVVDSINACTNQVFTQSAVGYSVGDRVLLIQMQGAEVNLTNSPSFGNLINYANAGNYELATISNISGTVVSFENGILRDYTNGASLQLVRVPVYSSANISSTLTAADWNGSTGGILVLEADVLTFSADIDVSGKGFRGGHAGNYPSSCPTGTGTSLYYADTLGGKGGAKGEGIVKLAGPYLACRGKALNGGGGGNDHNAGAGGGALGSAGGNGGENDESFFSCPGSKGISAAGLDVTMAADKLFPGGGGGAGHGNNTNGTSGGDGGGIVFIVADQIIGNGHNIFNSGISVTELAWGDGAGGGGAGGMTVLIASDVSDLNIQAVGGKGGDVGAPQCTGPGGGGSGGVLKYSSAVLWPGVSVTLTGGTFGTNTTIGSDCFGESNGATAGANGISVSGMIAAESVVPYLADFANAGSDVAVCAGSTTMLNATGGVSYVWSPAIFLDDPFIPTPNCTPDVTTVYTVTVTNANGCTDTDVITIAIAPPVSADAGADVTLCSGESTSLSASGGVSYVWSPVFFLDDPFIPNPTATPLTDITYTVTVTDANGCVGTDMISIDVNSSNFLSTDALVEVCGGGSALLIADGGTSYSWSPATYLDATDIATPICTPTDDITYFVSATSAAGCVDVDTVFVSVIPAAFLEAGSDVDVCAGTSTELFATGGVSYSWAPTTYLDDPFAAAPICTPLSDIMYIVTAFTADGCTDTDTVFVYISSSDFAEVSPDVTVCAGVSTPLSASGGINYTWSPDLYLDDAFVADPICTPFASTTYFVSVENADGCTDVDTVHVEVIPAPIITAGPDTVVCYGGQIKLWCTEGESYLWTPATYLDVPFINGPTSSPFTSISYIVYVTDASGCTGSDTVDIIVHAIPDILASDDVTICRGDTVSLTATGGITYTWSPEPLEPCVDCAVVDVSPTETTTYLVQGTDANGCSETDEVIVTVDICNSIQEALASACTIFPNPSNGRFIISLPTPDSDVTVEVFNMLGEKLALEMTSSPTGIEVTVASNTDQQVMVHIYTQGVRITKLLTLVTD